MKVTKCQGCGCKVEYEDHTEKPQLCEDCEFDLFYEEDDDYDFGKKKWL